MPVSAEFAMFGFLSLMAGAFGLYAMSVTPSFEERKNNLKKQPPNSVNIFGQTYSKDNIPKGKYITKDGHFDIIAHVRDPETIKKYDEILKKGGRQY